MNDLIIDLLDLSRIARQELNIQELNLSTICAHIIDDLRSKNPERKVHISIQPDLFTLGDERLIQIALTNLLENAWKYTLKTVEPVVEVYSKELDGYKTFCISDNGAGFNMSKADKLFKPFQRLHSDKEFKGTGIGLAIVARVINRHGGKIWVEAQEGKGATFLIQFPAVQKISSSTGSLSTVNFV
jgi:signal transduction histidine kinase